MTFRIEGDYIVFDYRRIARLLPSLALCDLRAAERALAGAELPSEGDEPDPMVEGPPSDEHPYAGALERLKALSAISGGLLSMSEIEDALS